MALRRTPIEYNDMKYLDTVMYKGNEVEFISKSGGWTTILLSTGSQVKVRNSAVTPAKAPAPAPKAPAPKAPKAPKAYIPEAFAPKAYTTDSTKLLNPDLTKYTQHEVTTASGRKSVDINDTTAAKLRGCHLQDAYEIVAEEMIKLRGEGSVPVMLHALHGLYDHLNPGMQRMNLGNSLRGEISRKAKRDAKASK